MRIPSPSRSRGAAAAGIITALLLGSSGCGSQIYFKRGAGEADFARAREVCASGTAARGERALVRCMSAQGWYADDLAPGTVAAVPAEMHRQAAPAAGVGLAASPVPATAGDAAGEATAAAGTPQVIGSWFKLGAQPGDLERAEADCIRRLGDTARPDPATGAYPGVLLGCLRAQGWYGFRR